MTSTSWGQPSSSFFRITQTHPQVRRLRLVALVWRRAFRGRLLGLFGALSSQCSNSNQQATRITIDTENRTVYLKTMRAFFEELKQNGHDENEEGFSSLEQPWRTQRQKRFSGRSVLFWVRTAEWLRRLQVVFRPKNGKKEGRKQSKRGAFQESWDAFSLLDPRDRQYLWFHW